MLLAASLLFGACGNDDNDEPGPEPKQDPERTVLIYMAADNNLTTLADLDFKELKEGSKQLNDRQNLIIFLDKGDFSEPFIARLKDGAVVDSTALEECNTADPALLEELLTYVREKYPAKSYGLSLWGHANGWLVSNDSVAYTRSYGVDWWEGKSYWMNIPSMARAITKGMGSEHLSFIFADCCNFGCIESAYELRKVTDYLIASPAEIPDPGAPYQLILPALFNTSETFYQSVIDTYYDFYIDDIKARPNYYYNKTAGDLAGYSVPLVAIKSAELDNLAQATARLLNTIPDKLKPEGNFDLNNGFYYGYSSSYKYAYDIYHTLRRNTSESDFNSWESSFRKVVPYSRFSAKWLTGSSQLINDMYNNFNVTADDCGLVSMFFPRIIYKSASPNWNIAIQNFQWNSVIRWQQYDW